ncbi:ABC transporter permease [Brachybacterium saurashtrense]|uniref:ABC transporter permease n=1 Tax=Brachybacterium saurashtrense TaxID=556288 RepID=A0A345YL57_9MICO|nr:ABC transporter permease [Brachybacterium saurashtrense]AXK44659.1 ABC transporter permease [Brachybacterium saurashtrense]RRR23271.1 ABC transporter permease [Brachybacterium saurashtrense]
MPSDTQKSRRPEAEHWVAPLAETPLQEVDAADTTTAPRSLWAEAGHSLIRNPVFVISALLILFVLFVAVFPQVFTSQDPRFGDLGRANQPPGPEHPFGTSRQGYDIMARTFWGARTSVIIGFFAMIGSTLIGGTLGALAGYLGGWFDEVLSRVTDIFFAVPLILGAIVVATRLGSMNMLTVILVLSVFGWTNVARIMRGSVISTKSQDFVTSSVALGASSRTVLLKHVIPNAIAPVIVTATVNLGVFIVAEATLSFLGVGLPTSAVSWGGDIADARDALRTQPSMLFYPSVALAITVLSFIMLGDAVRDALDPKARKR